MIVYMAQNQHLSEPFIGTSGPNSSASEGSWYSRNRKNINIVIIVGIFAVLIFWYCKEKLLFNHDAKVDEVASLHHEYPARLYSISYDNTILVTATESGEIHAWNIQEKASLSKFVYPGKITAIDITYNNKYIVASGEDNAVRAFSLKTGSQIAEFLHTGHVTKFQIPTEQLYVVTISGDDYLRIWSIEKNNLNSFIKSSGGVITTFDYNATYDNVAFGTQNGLLEVWNTSLVNFRSFSYQLESPITQVNLNVYEEQVSVQLENNSFAIVTTKSKFWRLKAKLDFNFNNSIVKLGKESRYAVVGGDKIEVLDIYSEKKIDEFKHGNRVNSVAITPYGYHVVSASDDNTIRVWEVGSGNEATSIRSPGKVNNIVLSQDLKYFAAGGDDGYVRVYTLYI
jgi:WD40 repeat protein